MMNNIQAIHLKFPLCGLYVFDIRRTSGLMEITRDGFGGFMLWFDDRTINVRREDVIGEEKSREEISEAA